MHLRTASEEGGDDRSIGGGTVLLGVLTLAGMLMVGARQQPEGWEAWTVPTIPGIVFGFVNFFLGRHSRESAGPFAKRRPNTEVPDITRRERIRSAAAALPGDERERLLAGAACDRMAADAGHDHSR